MKNIEPLRASDILATDKTYVKQVLTQLWEELPLLLAGGLLVDLVAVPGVLVLLATTNLPLVAVIFALTAIPAWAGYCYMVSRNAAGFKPRLPDLLRGSVHYYWRSIVLGLPVAAMVPLVALSYSWLAQDPPVLVVTGITLQIIALFMETLWLLHALPLLAGFDLSLKQAATNSLILVLRRPFVAIGLMSMAGLLTLGARALGIGGWLMLPVLWVPFEVNATLMLANQMVQQT